MDYNGFVYINSVSIVVRKEDGERGGGVVVFYKIWSKCNDYVLV